MEQLSKRHRVVIIGAGLAGLTVAYHLKRQGIISVILDKGDRPGSSWLTRHPQLTLNTHRSVSHLPKFPYPDRTPAFPRRDDVASHLADFAAHHAFDIRHGSNVDSVRNVGATFEVEVDKKIIVAENVVVATGRDQRPAMLAIEGLETFGGRHLHASAFGDAKQYAGQKILVVGGGNSGFDIVNHLSRVPTVQVWLSVRSGSAVLPKRLKGIAVHRLSPVMDLLPSRVSDVAIRLTEHIAFGDLRKIGLHKPTQGAATRLRQEHIAIPVDDGAITSIKKGQTSVVREVMRIDKQDVLLSDGKTVTPDVIIMATGYSSGLSDLLRDVAVLDGNGNPVLRNDFVSCNVPSLWFAGMTPGLVSYFRNTHREGISIAASIVSRNPAASAL